MAINTISFPALRLIICAIAFAATAAIQSTARAQGPHSVVDNMTWLDNGRIRLGVDLTLGGAVTYLGPSKTGPNLINSFDCGREVQLSFYSGPNPFEPNGQKPAPQWAGLGWNPIQCGDYAGNRSKILESKNDGKTITVKCIPMQWPLNNVPGECTFECVYRLSGSVVEAACTLNNSRSDLTQYSAHDQELPAVYTNGPWYRLVSYIGEKPFTHDIPTTIVDLNDGKGWPWVNFNAVERWTALVNSSGFGLGVWNPGTTNVIGGFSGAKGAGGEQDSPTGYIAPLRTEILDHNIVYTYSYALIVGTIDQIRDYAYAHRPKADIPNYTFKSDRQGWSYAGCTDSGWPISNCLDITAPPGARTALVGPKTFWNAEAAPALYIRASFKTDAGSLTVTCEQNIDHDTPCWGSPPPERRQTMPASFDIIGDGVIRTYAVNLNSTSDYTGGMDKLNIALPPGHSKIYAIGFNKSAVDNTR
jgi:hypothetical protein